MASISNFTRGRSSWGGGTAFKNIFQTSFVVFLHYFPNNVFYAENEEMNNTGHPNV